MARQIGSGWRRSVSARVVMVIGTACVATAAFAVPALADDNGGHDGNNGNSHGDSAGHQNATSNSNDNGSNDNGSDGNRNDDGSGDDGDQRDGGKNVDPNLVEGTPCSKTARACVDLKSQEAWLIDPAGAITRGPVQVSSGGPGEETPVGTFAVQWKDKNHKSTEYKEPNGQSAPMPYSVFFTNGGVAFHGGSLSRASAGCVHLDDTDAVAFYNTLKLGDQVQVH